jgi:CHAD domain-containing protein
VRVTGGSERIVMDDTTPGAVASEVRSSEPDPPVPETSSGDSPEPAFPAPSPEAVGLAAAALVDGRTPGVRADDPWAEAGRKVLRFHLAKVLARVPGVIAGEDAEEVHAMRVAARRMRAAWRVFGDGFERDAAQRYRAELRAIGGRLGAVRDLDVLLEIVATHGRRRGARQRAGLEPLLAAWRAERERRHADLTEALRSERFTAFVADYRAFVETPGLAALAVPPHRPAVVRTRMPSTIWAAYQAVWAFDDGLGTADLATLHELRIAAKWLRYTLEFVREPMEPEATALIRTVVALQDLLGDQHDRHVAGELARAFLTSATLAATHAKATTKLIEHLDQDVERLSRAFGSTWRPLADSSYRRGLGRAIARL